MQQYPRSPKALLGGIAHLGRFIDKIRLRHAGAIQNYNYIMVGFDKYLAYFLHVDPKGGRRIHVVVAPKGDYLAVITAYVPDPTQWSPDFLRRV